MFTGIVEAVGKVSAVRAHGDDRRLEIEAPGLVRDLEVGGSIAVNGACLTAVAVGSASFAAEVVPETLRRTNLGGLTVGSPVNLERPLRADGRFDGHIVQGHVDALGEIERIEQEGEGRRLSIGAPAGLLRYVVEKGSITVDGISLTIAGLYGAGFVVALIPHTLTATTMGLRRAGDQVNLEFDVLAKYVERLIEARL